MDYGEFLDALEPVTLGLDSATISLNRDAYWSPPKSARRVLSSKYALAQVANEYFDVQASFSVSLQWSEGDGPVVHALKIDCVFTGHFHADAPINPEHAHKFTDSGSWLVFWPFFRQFVSDTTSRMGIPPILMPMALGPGEFSRRPTPQKALTEGKPHKTASKRQKRVTGAKTR